MTGNGLRCAWLMVSMAVACPAMAEHWDAVVSTQPGEGHYTTLRAALNAAPAEGTPWRIQVKNGVWQERLVITKPVTLVGESQSHTIIEANTPAGALDETGKKWGTFRTSTVEVQATGVTLENLTIRNTFDFPANSALPDSSPNKLKETQAVALMVSPKVDKARFRHITLEGWQDTFYSQAGSRSYFTDCRISGHVDFIFGAGIAVFDRCDIVARNRHDIAPPLGYVTAPSTHKDQPYGLVFLNSHITKEDGVPARSFALGRPWHPTTTFPDGRYADPDAIGTTAYVHCRIDDHIYGWDRMSGKDKQGNTQWFTPEESRFYELGNTGPGAGRGGAHYQLPPDAASRYTLKVIFPDWDDGLLQ